MTGRIRSNLELMKYGYNRGLYAVLQIIMVCLGLLLILISRTFSIAGAFFLMGSVTCVSQPLSSVGMCSLAKTSPKRKVLETRILPEANVICCTLLYLLALALRLIEGIWLRESLRTLPEEMILMGLSAAGVMVFLGLAYKFMVLATMFYALCYYIMIQLPQGIMDRMPEFSLAAGVGIGLLEIALGALIQGGLAWLLYRLSPSKLSQDRGLRRYL